MHCELSDLMLHLPEIFQKLSEDLAFLLEGGMRRRAALKFYKGFQWVHHSNSYDCCTDYCCFAGSFPRDPVLVNLHVRERVRVILRSVLPVSSWYLLCEE